MISFYPLECVIGCIGWARKLAFLCQLHIDNIKNLRQHLQNIGIVHKNIKNWPKMKQMRIETRNIFFTGRINRSHCIHGTQRKVEVFI